MTFEDELRHQFDSARSSIELQAGSAAAVKRRATRRTRRRKIATSLAAIAALLIAGGVALNLPLNQLEAVVAGDAAVTGGPDQDSRAARPDGGGRDVGNGENVAGNYCPHYVDSTLFRMRSRTVTLGPDDEWEAAINGAVSDTEFLLEDGIYRMTGYSVFLNQPDITIRSASGDRAAVVIEGQGYQTPSEGIMVGASGITIADLSVTGVRDNAVSIKSEVGVDALQVYNVHLYDNGMQHIRSSVGGSLVGGLVACSALGYGPEAVQGDVVGAVHLRAAVDWTIRDNYIYNVTGDGSGCAVDDECGTHVSGPAILVFDNSRNATIERNTIVESWRSITLGLGARHDGATIRNNFILRTETGDAGIELHDVHDVTVEHNTVLVAGYQGAIEYGGSTGLTIRNNLISAPIWERLERGESTGVRVEGNITDATTEDLVDPEKPGLADGSQAIGAGVPSPVDHDIEGDAREQRWDVGADQFSDQS